MLLLAPCSVLGWVGQGNWLLLKYKISICFLRWISDFLVSCRVIVEAIFDKWPAHWLHLSASASIWFGLVSNFAELFRLNETLCDKYQSICEIAKRKWQNHSTATVPTATIGTFHAFHECVWTAFHYQRNAKSQKWHPLQSNGQKNLVSTKSITQRNCGQTTSNATCPNNLSIYMKRKWARKEKNKTVAIFPFFIFNLPERVLFLSISYLDLCLGTFAIQTYRLGG